MSARTILPARAVRRLRSILLFLFRAAPAAAPLLIADCSTPAPDGAASGIDATVPLCSPPANAATRCSGDDPTFVFFPPLACDPASRSEAGTPDGQSDAQADGGPMDPCAGVTTLDVFFTPEACRAFVMAEANGKIDRGPSEPVIDEPNDGDALTADHWSIFTWHKTMRDAHRDGLGRLHDLVEPSAYAYSPIRGDGYVLEFRQGCTEILRVMLAGLFWVPDPESWSRLTSVGGPIQVRVFAMRFADDALASTPVASPAITVTMQGDAGD
jgi:hypothetical protein